MANLISNFDADQISSICEEFGSIHSLTLINLNSAGFYTTLRVRWTRFYGKPLNSQMFRNLNCNLIEPIEYGSEPSEEELESILIAQIDSL